MKKELSRIKQFIGDVWMILTVDPLTKIIFSFLCAVFSLFAAEVMRGRKVAGGVRAIVIPATQRIWLQAMEEGLLRTFVEAGCVVSPPTCVPCLGGHMGILAKGERCVATTNRNFVGRMGHIESEVYLASPAVAAASAVAGRIAAPTSN